jgi:hypothetical protein
MKTLVRGAYKTAVAAVIGALAGVGASALVKENTDLGEYRNELRSEIRERHPDLKKNKLSLENVLGKKSSEARELLNGYVALAEDPALDEFSAVNEQYVKMSNEYLKGGVAAGAIAVPTLLLLGMGVRELRLRRKKRK